jgi:thiol-disulfide isomerase/thioredoxin
MAVRAALAALAVALALAPVAPAARAQDAPAKKPRGVGEVAPRLTDVEWTKGRPVKQWQRGTTYVLFFWTTWSDNCLRTIPFLDALQAQRKAERVQVVGIFVAPRVGAMTPERFLEQREGFMEFPVAIDEADRTREQWDAIINLTRIPKTVIIDAQGRIAWRGHPFDGVERALAAVLAGDEAALDALVAERKDVHAQAEPLLDRIDVAVRTDIWDAVPKAVDQLFTLDTRYYANFGKWKYQALVELSRDKEAAQYGHELLAGPLADCDTALADLAWYIVSPSSGLPRERRDVTLALAVAGRANELSGGRDWSVLDTLALAMWRLGDAAAAIEWQRKAVAQAFTGVQKRFLQERLDQYLAADAAGLEHVAPELGKK